MTQEEKNILLKDLCARLPYGVKVRCKVDRYDGSHDPEESDVVLNPWLVSGGINSIEWRNLKPYLRPMSSMTEEEKEFIEQCMSIACDENYGDYWSPGMWYAMTDFTDYCNSRFLDHRSLIEKGLALKATEDMYKL